MNVILVTVLAGLSGLSVNPVQNLFSTGVYSFFYAAGLIYLFRILFTGNYKAYFALHILLLVKFLFILLSLIYFGLDLNLHIIFPLLSFLWFIAVIISHKYLESEIMNGRDITDLYNKGFSVFIINSIAPVVLQFDKMIINNNMGSEPANAYTFAWFMVVPLFYIGNMFEKNVYSITGGNPAEVLRKSFILNALAILTYSILVTVLLIYAGEFLPGILHVPLVRRIFILMISGYSLYAVIHFPVNAFLFKYNNPQIQRRIAWRSGITALLSAAGFILMNQIVPVNYISVMIFSMALLYIMLFIKIISLWKNGLEDVFNNNKQIL